MSTTQTYNDWFNLSSSYTVDPEMNGYGMTIKEIKENNIYGTENVTKCEVEEFVPKTEYIESGITLFHKQDKPFENFIPEYIDEELTKIPEQLVPVDEEIIVPVEEPVEIIDPENTEVIEPSHESTETTVIENMLVIGEPVEENPVVKSVPKKPRAPRKPKNSKK